MVKLRISTVDAKAAIDEVRAAAVGKRLLNVYDLSPRVYLLKFGQGESKVYVLFEAGVRLHCTSVSREKPKVPSQFTLKLRKHVRSWRLESINQLGTDRVVDLQFGTGESAHHFVLELFGQGNFFLTDAKYTIMMLLRSAKSDDVRLAVREVYPTAHAKQFVPRTRDEIVEALTAAQDNDTLRSCLPLGFYGALLGDHMLASCGLSPTEKKKSWGDDIQRIADSVFDVCRCVDELMTQQLEGGGVLVKLGTPAEVKQAREAAAAAVAASLTNAASSGGAAAVSSSASDAAGTETSTTGLSSSASIPATSVATPDEFWPAAIEKFLDRSRIVAVERTPTFSEAADRCFSMSEQEKITQHNSKKDKAVLSKKEKFFRDHQRRIDNLEAETSRNEHLGDLIALNVEDVDAAIALVNDVLATGMSWRDLGALIRLRQSEGSHPIACIIHDLKLYRNEISLLLSQDCADDDELEDADLETVVVDVDISMSAYANAARYHGQKKAAREKLQKTIEATGKAAEAATRTGERVAKKVVAKRDLTAIRQPLWFEKFNWFITSHGYVVVSGHDPMQADLLFRRHLSPGDIWVHGDSNGCQPAIVKNAGFGKVPMATIEEAGIMCIARSEAWRKAPVSAWWCLATQISKRTPQGDHLGLGQFFVRGAKNYMPAMQLQLAVGVLFKCSKQRAPKETAGMTFVNVHDVWTQQQQQEQREAAAAAAVNSAAGAGARSAASSVPQAGAPNFATTPPHGPHAAPAAAGHNTSDEDRQTSGDMTDGNATSPTGARDGAFPAGASPTTASGPPLAAQLHLQQQQQAAAVDKRSKLRHLKRGQPSPGTVVSNDSASDTRTISLASTQTGSMMSRQQQGQDGPSARDVTQNSNLSSRHQSKLKKIKKKYANQDDDDRQRAMAILGNNVSKVHQAMLQAEAARDAEQTDSDEDEDDDAQGSSRVKFAQDYTAAEGEDADPEMTREQSAAAMEREHEAMNRRATSFEDDTAKIAERMAEEMSTVVPFLDGAPSAADVDSGDCELEDALIVCAPYAAIRHFTFKMRIAPGTDKKGQAAKAILDSFSKHVGRSMPQGAAAVKAASLESAIAQLAGPLKVHFADMAAPVTSTAGGGPTGPSGGGNAADGEASGEGLSVRQKQKLKQEEKERQMIEKLRAERKARLEAREKKAAGHADPTTSSPTATIGGHA